MGKRFTDTEVYDDPWYIELSAGQRLFWEYLLRKCDNAGVWKVNKPMAEFCVGMRLDLDEMLQAMGGRIMVFDNGSKWWIRGFCAFQYGELKDECRPHQSVIRLLQKHGIFDFYDAQLKGIDTLSDTLSGVSDTPKDKDKDKDKDKGKYKRALSDEQMSQFNNWYERYQKKVGREAAEKAWAKLTPEEVAKCLEVVDSFVLCHPEVQYRPHPATYLNGKRYNDQLVATRHYDPEIGF